MKSVNQLEILEKFPGKTILINLKPWKRQKKFFLMSFKIISDQEGLASSSNITIRWDFIFAEKNQLSFVFLHFVTVFLVFSFLQAFEKNLK